MYSFASLSDFDLIDVTSARIDCTQFDDLKRLTEALTADHSTDLAKVHLLLLQGLINITDLLLFN